METTFDFKAVYFTSLETMIESGEVKTNQDIKECLEFAVNQHFWNLSESFQASMSNLLMKEFKDFRQAKEDLKIQRLKNLEKARLVKALKKAELVKESEAVKTSGGITEVIEEEETTSEKALLNVVKELEKGLDIIKGKGKRKMLNDGISHEELVNVNGKTYRLVEA